MSAIGSSTTTTVTPPPSTTTTPSTGGGAGAATVALKAGGPFVGVAAFDAVAQGTAKVEVGARGAHVRTLETALDTLGYKLPRGRQPDDRFTRDTQNLLSRFQGDQGLARTGILDGPTLAALDQAIAARAAGGAGAVGATTTTDPLAGQAFIDKKTFASLAGTSWARDGVELEKAMGVTGVSGDELVRLLRAERGGRTNYERVRRPEDCEAFSVGFGVDEMPWDARSHRAREENPHVWLTIERERFEQDPETGERELSVGTDIMDDIYYDTKDFLLTDNDMLLRGRIRWDNADEVRRLLIGVKFGTHVNDIGIKSADKIDIRDDSPDPDAVKKLDESVRRGVTSWDGEPATPIAEVYKRLSEAGKLPDVGPHEDVLLLEPKAHLRSVRSRYHLNEAGIDSVARVFQDCGAGRLGQIQAMIADAKASGGIPAGDAAAVDAFAAKIGATLDGSLIAERAAAKLKELDPSFDPTAAAVKALMPSAGGAGPTSLIELEKQKVVAETVNAVYHELGEELDQVRLAISGDARGATADHGEWFTAWQKSLDPQALGKLTTPDRFVAMHKEMVGKPAAEIGKTVDAYNAYGEAQRAAGNRDFRDFERVDADAFKGIATALREEQVDIWHRQLEAAGSAAEGLWFDRARDFYVPDSMRSSGNFLIDTTDYVEMVTHENWESIPEADKSVTKPLPADKILHAALVNELQIELGREEAYVSRIRDLKGEIGADRASLLMRWADSVGHPGLNGAQTPDAYKMMFAGLKAMDDATLQGTVDSLNAFLAAQGSALVPLTVADLRAIEPTLLNLETKDRAIRKDGSTEKNLAGAEWVFSRYISTMDTLGKLKERRILGALEDGGGPAGMGWSETDMAKGDKALSLMRGAQP